ncbi:MAG: 3-hydroxyacyl-ACP dehydratase FabZ, partial [Phycisphaerae bacterium]
MTTTDFLQLIPHRPPFLFVDEVMEHDTDRIVTRKQVEPDAAFFQGHYPGNPIMPGVLLCECAFQAGAILLAQQLDDPTGAPVVTRIKDAKFKRPVRPGQTLTVEVVIGERMDDVYFMTGRISADGHAAARVEFACA